MRHHTAVRGLNYFGGKGQRQPWIAERLPWAKDSTYVEPFGGMMSVLLYRAAVSCELYNDQNGDIVNWWRCVQSRRDEFVQMIEATPLSRVELNKAKRILAEPWTLTDEPDLRRGHAVYTLLTNSRNKKIDPSNINNSYSRRLNYKNGHVNRYIRWRPERLAALAERLHAVQLECTDGVSLLERCVDNDYVVAYVDPPYQNSKSGGGGLRTHLRL